MNDSLTVILSAIGSTVTTLGALFYAVRWLATKLEYVNQIPGLIEKVSDLEKKMIVMDGDVKEAIGIKKHFDDIRKRLDVHDYILSEQKREHV